MADDITALKKKTVLTPELWKNNPVWSKQIFAIRLFNIIFPSNISRRLQKLIGDAGVFNIDLMPPGWIYDPYEFPPPIDYTSLGEYGSLPSWLSDVWGEGPVRRPSDPPAADYWFQEVWDVLDTDKWTVTTYAHGNVAVAGGYLVMQSTGAGLAFTLVHLAGIAIPSADRFMIRTKFISGSGRMSVILYGEGPMFVVIWYGTSSPSGLRDYNKSTINLWAKYGQDDAWRFDLRSTGWKAYLNGSLIAENTVYWLDPVTPAQCYIEGRDVFAGMIDYIAVEDISEVF